MHKRWKKSIVGALVAGGVWGQGAALAEESLQERFDRLEQRYNILERKVENDQEAAATKAKDAQSVTASAADGFQIRNADKSFVLRINGYVQADGRFTLDDDAKAQADAFLIRRARLDIRGTLFKFVDFRLQPSDDNNVAGLQDAFVNLRFRPGFQVLAGQTKVPFGLERLQSNSASTFVEPAHTTSLTPNYDVGLHVHGALWDGAATWTVAHTNGAVDGGSATGDTHDSKAWTARVFLLPFKSGGALAWKDLGFGFAAASDKFPAVSSTSAAGTGLTAGYRTPGQASIFGYANAFVSDKRVRWSPQAYWYPGSLGVLAEYVASRANVRRAGVAGSETGLTHRAWQVNASYSLTGETASYRSIRPLKPFDPDGAGWGAFELAARYSELRIDPAAFQGAVYASATTQAQRARTWTGGLNWHLNAAAKVQLEYDYTRFTGGAAAGQVRAPARELLSRFQVQF